VLVPEAEWALRPHAERSTALAQVHAHDLGRELFAGMRRNVNTAEEGACSWL
jgi:phosphogluconate dehydratase